MREIKFRCFYRGEMHYPNQEQEFANATFHSFQYMAVGPKEKKEMHLMEATGLKDKNGKEVYEGDVIKSPLGNIVQVKLGTKTYRAKMLPLPGDDIIQFHGWIVENGKGFTETLDETFLSGEVIGNIHQNPELL